MGKMGKREKLRAWEEQHKLKMISNYIDPAKSKK